MFRRAEEFRRGAYGAFPAPVELLAALRPLLVPIVLLGVVAVPSLPWVLSVAVCGAVALLLGTWIAVAPGEAWGRLKDTGRMLVKPLVLVGFVLFVAVTMAGLYLIGDPALRLERLDRTGGTPMALVIDATLIWILAFVLRMVGFGRAAGPWRWAVAVLVALTMLATLMYLKLLPSFDFDALPLVLLGVTLAALVVTSLVERGASPPKVANHTQAKWWWMRGVVWSLLSTIVLAIALLVSGFEFVTGRGAEVSSGAAANLHPRPPGQIKDDEELARAYMPVLVFSSRQRWVPEPVDDYYRGARIGRTVAESRQNPGKGSSKKADARQAYPTTGALPTDCPVGAPRPCWYLRCDSAGEPCARANDHLQEDREARERTAAYVRVVRRGENPTKDAAVFKDALPVHPGKVEILLQYWLFYPYDEWRAPVGGANIVQRHAGDWEAVTVALSNERPLWVGYSQHCGGRSRPWERVRVDDERESRTHPLVAVAVGSHANYEAAASVRSPDFTSCDLFPGESIALLSYSWNLRDTTRDDWRQMPKVAAIVDKTDPPMNFPGFWGKDDTTAFERFGRRTLKTADGPKTPSSQELWADPMYKMFCGPAWRPRARAKLCADVKRAKQPKR